MVFTDITSDHETSYSLRRCPKTLLLSVTTLVAQLAKRAGQVSKKLKPPHKPRYCSSSSGSSSSMSDPKSPLSTPRSPFTRPKQMLTSISNKAVKLVHRRKEDGGVEEGDFGNGGVWRKTILMGDKCQPLDFSGVIYYDENGNKLNQPPLRSPRASPMPGYLARREYT